MESLEARQLLSVAPVTFNFNPADFFEYDPAGQSPGSPEWRDGGLFAVHETEGFDGVSHGSWDVDGNNTLDDLKASMGVNEGIGEVQVYVLKSSSPGSVTHDWGQELTADPGTTPSGVAPEGWTAQGATDAGIAWVYQWEANSADYFIRPGDDLGLFSLSFVPNEAVTYGNNYTFWFGGENYQNFIPAISFDDWDPGVDGFASTPGSTTEPGTAYQASLGLAAAEAIPLGPVDFVELDVSTSTLFQLTTTNDAFLTVEASFLPAGGSVGLTLYDQDQNVLATSVDVDGNQRIDWSAGGSEEYYFSVDGTNPDVQIAVVNLLDHAGTTVTVYGTDGDDAYGFAPVASYEVVVNGVKYDFADAAVDTVTFNGGNGRDNAMITGLAGADLLNWADYQLTLTGTGVVIGTDSVEDVTVTSGGGADEAKVYDSDGDDLFTASPDSAILEATDYKLTVEGYRYVHAYANKVGTDEARFVDSPGEDKVKAEWKNGWSVTKMSGPDYYNRAKRFEKTVATFSAGGTNDNARLWDSSASDIFEGMPYDARFYSNSAPFDVTVVGADFMTVYGNDNNDPGSADQLILRDSPGDDVFRAKTHKVELFDRDTGGTVHKLVARRFKDVTATADQGGQDIAKLYDSTLDDLWEAEYQGGETWSKMASTSKDLYEVIAFEQVKGYSVNGGTNTLIKTIIPPEVDFVLTHGIWV